MCFVNDIVGFHLYDLTQALCNHLKKTTFVFLQFSTGVSN